MVECKECQWCRYYNMHSEAEGTYYCDNPRVLESLRVMYTYSPMRFLDANITRKWLCKKDS